MHVSNNRQNHTIQTAINATTERQINVNMAQSGGENLIGDPFDGSAEPTVYMSENRMPVMLEFSSTIIYIIFAALLLALISILPGVRRTKITSFMGLLTIILVGASILLSIEGSYWLTGELQLYEMPYGALTSETITGKLEVNIGLSSTNVTLIGRLMGLLVPSSSAEDVAGSSRSNGKFVDYNERFQWDRPDRMAGEHTEALRRGLPYPILTVTEFLSQDSEGFNWMRQLRQAGYFSSMVLYASLASWCLTVVIMCALPVYLPHMMQITGASMMAAVWIYTMLIHTPKSFVIQLGESPMEFAFGHTYVLTFMAGVLSMFSGVLMLIMQMNKPHESLTIMDCESFSKNRKAFYADDGKLDSNEMAKPTLARHRLDSVVIPISDIAEKFAPKQVAP